MYPLFAIAAVASLCALTAVAVVLLAFPSLRPWRQVDLTPIETIYP